MARTYKLGDKFVDIYEDRNEQFYFWILTEEGWVPGFLDGSLYNNPNIYRRNIQGFGDSFDLNIHETVGNRKVQWVFVGGQQNLLFWIA